MHITLKLIADYSKVNRSLELVETFNFQSHHELPILQKKIG